MKDLHFIDSAKAKDILFDMFLAYVRSAHFGNLTDKARKEVVDTVDELKSNLFENDDAE